MIHSSLAAKSAVVDAAPDISISRWTKWEPVFKFTFLISAVVLVLLAIEHGLLFNADYVANLKGTQPFFWFLYLVSSIIFVGAVLFRTFLWFRYKPYDSSMVESWPEVTIIVPAYNEGSTVLETLNSIARCDYPSHLVKVIAVDDGSRDDTYAYLLAAKRQHPNLVELVRFKTNRGKREALYAGFKKTKSPFVITVDSDTCLDKNAIKELLTPLISNPKIGAVTGKVKIWNSDANIFTKILKTNFAMAFDYSRAVQSTFSCVLCSSGAFTAFRTSLLQNFMEKWLNQTFLRQKCTYGEDRSLTNFILLSGAGTAYQQTAICLTKVPESGLRIIKMLTRWARSNIRESLVFARVMFHKNRKGNQLLPFIEFTAILLPVLIHLTIFYYCLLSGFAGHDGFFLRNISYSLLFGFFFMLYFLRIEGFKDSPYIVLFSLFSCVFVTWIFTYACCTLTTRKWSTR